MRINTRQDASIQQHCIGHFLLASNTQSPKHFDCSSSWWTEWTDGATNMMSKPGWCPQWLAHSGRYFNQITMLKTNRHCGNSIHWLNADALAIGMRTRQGLRWLAHPRRCRGYPREWPLALPGSPGDWKSIAEIRNKTKTMAKINVINAVLRNSFARWWHGITSRFNSMFPICWDLRRTELRVNWMESKSGGDFVSQSVGGFVFFRSSTVPDSR